MLFANYQRTDAHSKAATESDFHFLDRSARPEIACVRQKLEDLISEYPAEHSDELNARIACGDDTHFRSATFELLLHAFLIRMGYTLFPHPDLNNGSNKRPDFLVVTPEKEEFYLEAVLASSRTELDPGSQALIDTTLEFLSQAKHHNFMIAVESLGKPSTQPSGKKLRAETISWLNCLDPDEISSVIDQSDFLSAPTYSWTHEDWEVLLRPIPLKPDKRGKADTLVGLYSAEAGFVDEWTPIRDAVSFKGSRYGDLAKPLIVAVNTDVFDLDRIDEMQALYGQEQFVFRVGLANEEPQCRRASNGAWLGKSGPQATRVSGAWLFNNLTPYSLARRKQTIYFNPWAKKPLPEELKRMPHAIPLNEKMEWKEGLSLKQVFGLPDGWPE